MKIDIRSKSPIKLLIGSLFICFILYNHASYAEMNYHYRYFSFQESQFPPGFTPGVSLFNHTALGENGKVYGTLIKDVATFSYSNFAVYENGVVTIVPGIEHDSFFAIKATKTGIIGGITDVVSSNLPTSAALLTKDKIVKIPGNWLCDLTDAGTALVHDGDNFEADYSIVKYGIKTPVSFGPIVPIPAGNNCGLNFNHQATIAGTTTDSANGRSRGFILAKGANQQPELLMPKATETDSIAFDINNRGNVFGFSYNPDGVQRVGLWHKDYGKWKFNTFFIQGTVEFPTISGLLVANDNNQMVITNVTSPTSELGKSYLVTKPGNRLNLKEITENVPNGIDLCFIDQINSRGDMTGFSCTGDEFILKRNINEDMAH